MDHSRKERRRSSSNGVRKTFGDLAAQAIRKRVSEANGHAAHWLSTPNLAWVRWRREDGRYVHFALRRRLDWLTGEIGSAAEPLDLEDLKLVTSPAEATCGGCRIQLGPLLHGQDRWWSAGQDEKSLVERLDWIALQTRLKIQTFVSSTLSPRA